MTEKWTPLAIMQFAVSAFCLVAVTMIAGLAYFVEPPGENQRILDVILGALMTVGFANIIGFLFGQKEQSEQAVRIAQASQTAQPVEVVNTPANAVPVERLDSDEEIFRPRPPST